VTHICLNVLTLVRTDEEKHLSKEAIILTGGSYENQCFQFLVNFYCSSKLFIFKCKCNI
jgi:hypothetical protein